MMHLKSIALVVLWSLLASEAPQGDAVKKDMDSLRGDWVMQSSQRKSIVLPEGQVEGVTRTIKGNEFTVFIKGMTRVIELKCTFKLDPTRVPKHIDWTLTEGPGKGQTVFGIYKLGDATLTECVAPSGEPRPRAFDSAQGVLTVWKRRR
jgi:uncharacterized protein (TIGR03067 family)